MPAKSGGGAPDWRTVVLSDGTHNKAQAVQHCASWLANGVPAPHAASPASSSLAPTRTLSGLPPPTTPLDGIMQSTAALAGRRTHVCATCSAVVDEDRTVRVVGNPYTFQNTLVVCTDCRLPDYLR